jgi:hypothetical protein
MTKLRDVDKNADGKSNLRHVRIRTLAGRIESPDLEATHDFDPPAEKAHYGRTLKVIALAVVHDWRTVAFADERSLLKPLRAEIRLYLLLLLLMRPR